MLIKLTSKGVSYLTLLANIRTLALNDLIRLSSIVYEVPNAQDIYDASRIISMQLSLDLDASKIRELTEEEEEKYSKYLAEQGEYFEY